MRSKIDTWRFLLACWIMPSWALFRIHGALQEHVVNHKEKNDG